jgi:tetratricopeptide (TPR) repeat protein
MEDRLSDHRERFVQDPDATASFQLLEEDCFLSEEWLELAKIYRHRLRARSLVEDARGRAQIQLRLAKLLEERIGDEDGAIDAYRECVQLDAALRPAWERLHHLYTKRESWTAVLQVAELEATAITDAAERARLFNDMGDIWQDRLGDAEQAEQYYVRARFERDALPPEVDPKTEEDDSATLVQSAWISAARGDSHAAVTSLRQALDGDPSNIEAIDMLATVLEGAERHAEMAELLERRAALAADPATQAAVLARLGLVREQQLGDPGGARSAYERALAADPSNQGAQLALTRIYRLTEAWSDLRGLLEIASAQGPAEQRADGLCQLGLLLERQFGDIEAALSSFDEALALEPDCVDARAALMRLRELAGPADDENEQTGSHEHRAVRVVGVLERKLERLESEGRASEENAIKLRLRLAELRSATLEDPVAAIAALEPCLDDDEALLLVAQRLARLYEAASRPEDLIPLARRAAAASADPTERAEWHRRAAETAAGIGDADSAVEFYQRLLDDRPGDRQAEAQLLALHRARGEARPLAALLRSELFRAAPRDELPLHLELADLFSRSLDEPRAALAHWRRALALDPARGEVLDEALRCAERTGGALHQLDLLEHLAAAATTNEDRARLLVRRGDLLASDLGWAEEGVESWRRSLELDPDQPDARARLESLAPPT